MVFKLHNVLHCDLLFSNIYFGDISLQIFDYHPYFPQGFLAKDLQAEALSKLDHRVKIAAEQFMKFLEQIDAMVNFLFHI